MILNFKEFGAGFPLVVIHGLYGSSDNWVSIARVLAARFRVIVPDMRNHGRSPHSQVQTYQAMVDDLYHLFQTLQLSKAHILGHSMGGRVAMLFNQQFPQLVSRLVVVDIPAETADTSHIAYRMAYAEHRRILKALSNLPIATLENRQQADQLLRRRLPHEALRKFLLKNLCWNHRTGYSWRLNINALQQNLEPIMLGVHLSPAPKTPALLVHGDNSIYLLPEQFPEMLRLFPLMRVVTVCNSGHLVHFEQPAQFVKLLTEFLFDDDPYCDP